MTKGTDMVGQAQTGTGKTAAFGLPLLERINPKQKQIQGLVLAPTRELSQQIAKSLFRWTKYSEKIFTECVYGGAPIGQQVKNLLRPTHIVVATPGRLIDLIDRQALDLSAVRYVVLDEADEMLNMGFKKDIDRILRFVPKQRNTWLFSATMPNEVRDLVRRFLSRDAFRVGTGQKEIVNRNITHQYAVCPSGKKFETLLQFLRVQGTSRGVVFCRTKLAAAELARQLSEQKHTADAIQGNMSQKERDKVMRAFKKEKLKILVATDVAARGIDVENLAYVVHYQLPESLEYYTHRSGRTGRAGKKGLSLALIEEHELRRVKEIAAKLKININPAV
ncbi:MAG: DEAD/DEAH box helicase [Cytophagales bacterium]|nr:DEAD/DEAH box helicase [Cytophagales bacterium]